MLSQLHAVEVKKLVDINPIDNKNVNAKSCFLTLSQKWQLCSLIWTRPDTSEKH